MFFYISKQTIHSSRQQIIGDYNLLVTLQLYGNSTKIRDTEGPVYTTEEYERLTLETNKVCHWL